ncbi:hypothetical protein [Pseudomonas sp. SWRI154]|uniref:hypothetical protein n=1 Tax=Pseudomonas sp. SWRI154 TaxID=2745501 RepID=UPI0016460B98|nr:hypothetical protein [Pseudomonas sp. SWRI154]MBC3364432.1 hypothetical protein [Pseudomonas sp. SWRI154]
MDSLKSSFTETQRRTLDRRIYFLDTLRSVFDKIPLVLERRRISGHQSVTLAADTRLNNAYFHAKYLLALEQDVNAIRVSCGAHTQELRVFTQEALGITAQTSGRQLLADLDFRQFSFSRSERWMIAPPMKIGDLVHEFFMRFITVRSSIRQLWFKFNELNNESFGVTAVFTSAMEHRSCHCHAQPTLVQALFQEADTTPPWDIVYSSRDASVRAAEYKADIASLSNAFVNLNSHMSLLTQALYQQMQSVENELDRAISSRTLGELNLKLDTAITTLDHCLTELKDFETWLRK